MFEIGRYILAVHRIPEMHDVIGSRRDDLPAIRRPCQCVNGAIMALVCYFLSPQPRIEDIDFIFTTATCQARTIGRPRQGGDGLIRLRIPESGVTYVRKYLFSRKCRNNL